MSMKNEMIPVTSGDDYDLIFWIKVDITLFS